MNIEQLGRIKDLTSPLFIEIETDSMGNSLVKGAIYSLNKAVNTEVKELLWNEWLDSRGLKGKVNLE